MTELPDEDREIIDADIDETLIEPIAEILYSGDRAWYTKNQINTRLQREYNQDVSNPTISDRLDRLIDLELVKIRRVGQTDIFYYSKGSEWPIPPDVRVEPTENEMTVSEFVNRIYVQWGGIAVVAILLGGIIMWLGSLQATNLITLPFQSSEILAIGLLIFLISYILILIAVVVGLLDFAVGVDLPDFLTTDKK